MRGVETLDGVLFTHDHADPTHGIDVSARYRLHAEAPGDVYMDAYTAAS
jgi:phosphoribosyl 1,2-cyclic phosphodiesterase